jgi:hypothetical protein
VSTEFSILVLFVPETIRETMFQPWLKAETMFQSWLKDEGVRALKILVRLGKVEKWSALWTLFLSK